jgi:hypothetical protein
MGYISTLIEDIFSPKSETMRDTMALIRNLGVQLQGIDTRAQRGTLSTQPIRLELDSPAINQTKLVA